MVQIPLMEFQNLQMDRPQLSCFCPHLFRPFLISKLRRSHCSAFPASEEIFAHKKASFLSPVAQNGYVPIPRYLTDNEIVVTIQ